MKVKNINEDNYGIHRVTVLVWISAVLWCIAGCIPDKDWVVTLNIHRNNHVRSIAWNFDGTQIAVANGKQVDIWDTGTWTQVQSIGDGSTDILGAAWRSDGSELATTDFQEYLTIWDATSGDAKARIKIDNYFIDSLFWPTNSNKILAFYDSLDRTSVEIIGVSDNSLSRSLLQVERLNSYSDDLCWLRIAEDESVSVIRILDDTFDESSFEAIQGVCSPNGLYFAAYNTEQSRLNIWNIQISQQIASIPNILHSRRLLWSPDGSKLIGGSNLYTRFFVWDAIHPGLVNYVEMPDDHWYFMSGPRDLSWSPDGDKIALVAGVGFNEAIPSRLVLIWDMNQLQLNQTIRVNVGCCIAWRPDSLQIAVVAEGVKVWHVN